MKLGLPGRRQCGERATVEAVLEGDDAVASVGGAVQPCQFDRPFDCFGPAVAEEGLAETPRAEELGKVALRLGVPRVGYVNQLGHLLLNRADDRGRRVAEQVAAPTGKQIEIAVALGVPDERPFTADEGDRIPLVVRNDVLAERLDGLLAAARRGVFHGVSLICRQFECDESNQ